MVRLCRLLVTAGGRERKRRQSSGVCEAGAAHGFGVSLGGVRGPAGALVHSLGETLQLGGGSTQGLRTISADVGHHLIVDVVNDACADPLPREFQPRANAAPMGVSVLRSTYADLSTVDYRDEENAWSMQLRAILPHSALLVTNLSVRSSTQSEYNLVPPKCVLI